VGMGLEREKKTTAGNPRGGQERNKDPQETKERKQYGVKPKGVCYPRWGETLKREGWQSVVRDG